MQPKPNIVDHFSNTYYNFKNYLEGIFMILKYLYFDQFIIKCKCKEFIACV